MNDNPKTNRSLPDVGFDRIDHALGRPKFPLRKSVRNHFATSTGSDVASALASSPNWEKGGVINDGCTTIFHVTPSGRVALATYLKTFADVANRARRA